MIKALITQREDVNKHGGLVDSLEKEYVEYFNSLGITVFPVSNFCNVHELFNCLDFNLLILSGGGVLPEDGYNYPREGSTQIHRDKIEVDLINLALKNDIPVIGICRGMQLINYCFKGMADNSNQCNVLRPVRKSHPVKTSDGIKFSVNNFHSDVIFIDDLGKNLIQLAVDDENNTVEAFKHSKKSVLGIQWHPERNGNDEKAEKWVRKQILDLLN